MGAQLAVGAHVVAVLVVVLAAALLGRLAARAARQPEVIGEILAGILIVPVVAAVAGHGALAALLPPAVLGVLKYIGKIGLVLFLVGVAHELRRGSGGLGSRSVGWVTIGSFFPALVAGFAFAGWVVWSGGDELRGTAPVLSLVLMIAVALSVTAVPVLARILEDRDMMAGRNGKLSMAAAVFTDSTAWLLLVVAMGTASGGWSGVLRSFAVLLAGVAIALLGRVLLRGNTSSALAARVPKLLSVGVAVVALVLAIQMEHWGLTAVFGAFVVGLAMPNGEGAERWEAVTRPVASLGRLFVPVFFVVAGMGLFATPSSAMPWLAVGLATALAIVGKVGGGYLGARLGGETRRDAVTIGVLMNTRGLTEIVVLQAGYSAGLLSAGLFLALVVMALVTTALTGPLLSLIDLRARRTASSPVLELQGGRQ
ncbi:cation:proton antiporter [Umezawaea sp. Da 62-37]|uniref:cation:proton antiporter n=1 Tax=Umezawaea sp. Da 62-37 TaxID=3075927 RepID=UPI0028F7061E|nr:cation:proton antiporter [Umezawaea sp. Da 62-37]WNV84496.1 cation:proton antiporter [Umezawaea sp. Da 62-37]